jgi:hypothetical protein
VILLEGFDLRCPIISNLPVSSKSSSETVSSKLYDSGQNCWLILLRRAIY